jgi:hypothetical protein
MDDFEARRNHLWDMIDRMMATKTLSEVRRARQMLRDWMVQHPDDYYSQDGGEEVAMMEEALEILEAEKAAEPVAA